MHTNLQLYIYYCIDWSWRVFDQTVEGGSSPTSMVPAHLSGLLNKGRGKGTETCEVNGAVIPDDLGFIVRLYMIDI